MKHAYLLFIIILVFSVVVSSCSENSKNIQEKDLQLTQLKDCDQLKEYLIEAAAVRDKLQTYYIMDVAAPTSGDSSMNFGSSNSQEESGDRDYSSTNVQEQGVDEPDIVKTDGEYIYVLSGDKFLIIDAWPADKMSELARTDIGGSPVSLFVYKDSVMIFSNHWQLEAVEKSFNPGTHQLMKVTILDVSDKSDPQLVREMYLEGTFTDARMVDGYAYFVISSYLDIYSMGSSDGSDMPAVSNRLANSDLVDLFPEYMDRIYGESGVNESTKIICPCSNVYHSSVPNGTGVVTLFSVNLGEPQSETHSTSILSDTGIVYGSEKSLYIAAANNGDWMWWNVAFENSDGPVEKTAIHEFELGESPSYIASGEVKGHVLNQFSMSEHEGVFRIATTERNWWSGTGSANAVYTLKREGKELQTVGALSDLGKPGESIYAVRFQGDKGFVITYERTDPMYTLDLSDPSIPKKVGELEIPGFSTYLHPVTDNKLLSIGRNADNSIELKIFDVSDFSNPAVIETETIGTGGYSEAEGNHKAFTYFNSQKVLAIPVSMWSNDTYEYSSILRLYDVNTEKGFSHRGDISHSVFSQNSGNNYMYYSGIRRSFFIGNESDGYFLYSLSGLGLKVTALEADLRNDVALTQFTE